MCHVFCDLPCVSCLKVFNSLFLGHHRLSLDTYRQGCHLEPPTHHCGCGIEGITAREVVLTGLEGSLRVWNDQQLLDVSLERRKRSHRMTLVSQHASEHLQP